MQSIGPSISARARWVFSIDLRSLALVRVLIGSILLFDLMIRGADFTTWLTDDGVMPRTTVIDRMGDYRWSLYSISGHWVWALALQGLAAIAALALLVGYRARLAAVVSLVFLISLHNRAPLLLQGGDNLLLLILFWLCFLPIGHRYSVDAALVDPRKPPSMPIPNQYLSVATVAVLGQAMAVYFFSAFLKSGSEWYPDGTAIYYALHLDELNTSIAHLWKDELWLSKPLTLYVWWLELLGPILMLSPVLRMPLRLAMMFAFISLEIGFIFNLHIGLFPLVSISSILLFTPTEIWDRLQQRFIARRGEGLTLYYDQGCEFCLKMCALLKCFLVLPKADIAPAQRVPEIAEILDREFSWVVTDPQGQTHIKWAAMVAVFAHSPLFFWMAPPLRWMDGLGTDLYEWVAENRGAFGRYFAIWLPWRSAPSLPGSLTHGLALVLALYILLLNLATVPDWRPGFMDEAEGRPFKINMPKGWYALKNTLRLDQKWSMFAPYPKKSDGWLVIPGVTEDGRLVNVFDAEGAVTFEKPESMFVNFYSNYRWRKFLTRIPTKRYEAYRAHYGGWLCRQWNEGLPKGQRLSDFNIYRMLEVTQLPGRPMRVTRQKVWRHYCLKDTGDQVESVLKAQDLWDLPLASASDQALDRG